jgi:acetyl esterase/lipase
VGSADIFRDEDITYASRLAEAGVQVELHIWPGGIHGFDLLLPSCNLSQRSTQIRTVWIKTILLKYYLSFEPLLFCYEID